jgi:hypothetical protein
MSTLEIAVVAYVAAVLAWIAYCYLFTRERSATPTQPAKKHRRNRTQ